MKNMKFLMKIHLKENTLQLLALACDFEQQNVYINHNYINSRGSNLQPQFCKDVVESN